MKSIAYLALIGLLAACGGGSTTAPGATQAPPANAEHLPGTFSGDTEQQTSSFALTGGDYVVDWTAKATGASNECFFGPAMKQDSGTGFEDVVSADVSGTKSGSANLHDVEAGTWYFDVISHCTWTLHIRRG